MSRPALTLLSLVAFAAIISTIPAVVISEEGLESPLLKALQREVQARNPDAQESFWRVIAKQGAPLVESITDDEEHLLLSFLWRGDEQTKNVVLFSVLTIRADMGFTAEQLDQSLLSRLPRTDVWYRTFTIRHDARLTYYLSPNDSLLPASDRKSESDWKTLQPDPLNSNRYVLNHEGKDWVRSAVNLPGSTPVPWVVPQPDVPVGNLEEHHLRSTILDDNRRIWVYTPPGYTKKRKSYHLLVLFDGWTYAHMVPTTTILDNLLAAGKIDPTIAVLVDHKDRNLELSCHEPFNQFLIHELIPWVQEQYHFSTIPAETIVAGESRGGLGAVCAGWRHPEIFGNVLAQSGYYSWDPHEEDATYEDELEFEWITRQIAASPKVDLRFVLSVGKLEHDHDFPHSVSILQSNRHMRDVLLAKGYELTYSEVVGGHEIYSGMMALPDNLASMAKYIRTERLVEPQ